MKHLTEDQLYDLAVKVSHEEDFNEEDIQQMLHIAVCDECYRMLRCMMAAYDVSQNLGDYLVPAAEPVAAAAVRRVRAVIRLVVDAVKPVLTQLEQQADSWRFNSFDAPMLAGARSDDPEDGGEVSAFSQLMDNDDPDTFVAYDGESGVLTIQLDGTEQEEMPRAYLRLPDDTLRRVEFRRIEDMLVAEVSDLADGQYEIVLEK